ncbi:MAG TPA: N-acetylmuramoyl-L-alanine amidase [Acidimicrobiales bacterium]|jgi:N-acetylmuramoyl-L-alanine amidase|nr:N-acetylmuramoyl-L-alanine amidase [Acidimicrobiales bacterium]
MSPVRGSRREPAESPLWAAPRVLFLAALVSAFFLIFQATAVGGALRRQEATRHVEAGRAIDTRLFEPGACVEYQPTAGDRHLTVFLDAGHGGLDPGGVGTDVAGNTVYEANETLPVELDAMKLLRAKGFTVVVSRTGNETVSRPEADDLDGNLFSVQGVHDDVAARDECADMSRADLLLGIYFDAGGSSYDAGGVTGYDTARPFSAQSEKFAALVQNDVMFVMDAEGWGIPDLGVVDDSVLGGPALSTEAADYGHLLLLGPPVTGWFTTPSTMPGALIEPLFITDPTEAGLAESASGQQVIAGGISLAIEQYFAPSAPGGQNSEKGTPLRHPPRST